MQTMESKDASPVVRIIGQPFQLEDIARSPLFLATRDAIVVGGGPNNEILLWNPAAEQLYGYTSAEVVGQPLDKLVPDTVKSHLQSMLDSYSPTTINRFSMGAPIEIPARHKSGREMFVEFCVSPLDSFDDYQYAFALIRDCTERKRLEAERNALLADAQETLAKANDLASLKSDFVAMIAHEAGSPIAAIGGMVELLERDDLPEDQRKRLSHAIRSEVRVLQRLVSDVQNATSMERGEFGVEPEPVRLRHLIDDAILVTEGRLASHAFHLEPVPDVLVMADRERIAQVLQNLLGNAAKHTPEGTDITLRTRECDGHIHLDIIDDGPGISQTDLEHIFTKFGRGRDASGRRVPGMGLGLYLSRGIVKDHGSTLFATSSPGKGTTFSFDLVKAEE